MFAALACSRMSASRSLTCAHWGAEVERSFPLLRRPAGRTTFPAHPGASKMTVLQDHRRGRRRGRARRRQRLGGHVAARAADSRLESAWVGWQICEAELC
jgi:hypothetical protein